MKSLFSRFGIRDVVWTLAVVVLIKGTWFFVEVAWLRFNGSDYIPQATKKPLFYTTRFASAAPPKPKRPASKLPASPHNEIKQMELLAIYHSQDNDVATVLYKGKTEVIARGEKVGTYTLKSGGIDFAVFERNEKSYTLRLKKGKPKRGIAEYVKTIPDEAKQKQKDQSSDEIIADGSRRIVPREVLTKYTQDLKSIYRNIGISEVRNKGQVQGFKVTFVRKGSIFEKLGLQRDDVLTHVNGQPLNGMKAAFDAYRHINDATGLMLTIKRGNQTMELEYEID